jgi:hypothetical protein
MEFVRGFNDVIGVIVGIVGIVTGLVALNDRRRQRADAPAARETSPPLTPPGHPAPPQEVAPPPAPSQVAGRRDYTKTFGIIALIGALFCVPVGLGFSVWGIFEARRTGSNPILSWIALPLSLILGVYMLFQSGQS